MNKTLAHCINQARKLPIKRGRHRVYAAVVNSKGRIIGEGSNCYAKTHPRNAKYSDNKHYIHAEQRAIMRSMRNGEGVKLYIARVLKDGTSALAKPCCVCDMWIKDSSIASVEYTV